MNTLVCEELECGIYLLKLNRPRQLNALNTEMLGELEELLDQLGQEQNLRGLIITGEGMKAFAAGADIAEMCMMTSTQAKEFGLKGNRVFRKIELLPVPVIAAVNGYALGGGCELAMSCDLILCSTNAVFGLPETSLGITPGFGGTIRLMRRIGLQGAKELIFSARRVKAEEAVSLGLALKQCEPDELLKEAESVMLSFVKNSAFALSSVKKAILRGADKDVDQAILIEAECFSECFAHPDQRIRMEQMLSGRKG